MLRKLSLLLSLIASLSAACQATPKPLPAAKLKVVATFSILGDLVQNVGGDQIELRTLVGPDADTHTFEPSPADGAALASAALVFENGLGFEAWLNDLYQASDSKAKRSVVTIGIIPGKISLGEAAGQTDPHAWQDVSYTAGMVKIIREALVEADPAHADTYTTNAETYLKQLEELDQSILNQVATLPPMRRKLVTNHDALGYFARRYGFELIGSALGATGAGEPAAAQIAQLIDEVKSADIPVIFTENVENSKVIEQVAQEAGVVVGPPLYTDALSQPGTGGDTYLKMMRYNVTTLVSELQK